MSKLEWRWGKPDSPGLWARKTNLVNCGFTLMVTLGPEVNDFHDDWWCRISDIPVIKMPKKVTKRLWLRSTVLLTGVGNAVFERYWWVDDVDRCRSFGDYIRTDVTCEFEE